MSRPVIAVSSYLEPAKWGAWDLVAAVLPHWYVDLFQEAGARVIIIPPDVDADVSVLDRVDGLVLVGGADVDARLYGQPPHDTADTPRESRDASELALYRGARQRGLPVFGICRGLQIMAVAHGGSLHQHVPDISELTHRIAPGSFNDHQAHFVEGSLIASILGAGAYTVNSSHHQAVADAGDLFVSGYASDGTVEVAEDPSAAFVLGVQWHPEHPERREGDALLIKAFCAAAVRYRSEQ